MSMEPAAPIPFPAPARVRRRHWPVPDDRVPPFAIVAASAVVIAAPWLAGGGAIWGQAAVLLGIAGLLLVWAPKSAPHRLAVWALFGTLALCAVQFLPASTGGAKDLREALAFALEIRLPSTVSFQPWISLDHTLVLLAASAVVVVRRDTHHAPRAGARRAGGAGRDHRVCRLCALRLGRRERAPGLVDRLHARRPFSQ